MQISPLVSAVIPAHNAAATVGRAIASVLEQDYPAIEVVVVDDGSRDDTVHVIKTLGTSVRLIESPVNGGAAYARNIGVEHARGKYIAFLDADDVWLPSKIGRQVALMEKNQLLTLVTCDSVFIDPSGRVFKRSHERHPPASGRQAWKTLLAHNFIPTPTVLARRDDILAAGSFDTGLRVGEDLDLWIRLAAKGEVGVLNEVLVNIFDLPGSLMKSDSLAELEIALPMVLKYVAAMKGSLTNREARMIRGRLHFSIGCNLLVRGAPRHSLPLFMESARQRYRFVRSCYLLAKAAFFALLGKVAARPVENYAS